MVKALKRKLEEQDGKKSRLEKRQEMEKGNKPDGYDRSRGKISGGHKVLLCSGENWRANIGGWFDRNSKQRFTHTQGRGTARFDDRQQTLPSHTALFATRKGT